MSTLKSAKLDFKTAMETILEKRVPFFEYVTLFFITSINTGVKLILSIMYSYY